MWPAFWLLPQATRHGPPEIDVMEAWTNPIGTTPIDASSTSAAVHYGPPGYDPDLMHSVWYEGPDFTEDFHTYAVDWRPDGAVFSVDGSPVRSVAVTPDYPVQSMLAVFDFPERAVPGEPYVVPELVVDRIEGG
jgi:beta-glucanase (GH16 family)